MPSKIIRLFRRVELHRYPAGVWYVNLLELPGIARLPLCLRCLVDNVIRQKFTPPGSMEEYIDKREGNTSRISCETIELAELFAVCPGVKRLLQWNVPRGPYPASSEGAEALPEHRPSVRVLPSLVTARDTCGSAAILDWCHLRDAARSVDASAAELRPQCALHIHLDACFSLSPEVLRTPLTRVYTANGINTVPLSFAVANRANRPAHVEHTFAVYQDNFALLRWGSYAFPGITVFPPCSTSLQDALLHCAEPLKMPRVDVPAPAPQSAISTNVTLGSSHLGGPAGLPEAFTWRDPATTRVARYSAIDPAHLPVYTPHGAMENAALAGHHVGEEAQKYYMKKYPHLVSLFTGESRDRDALSAQKCRLWRKRLLSRINAKAAKAKAGKRSFCRPSTTSTTAPPGGNVSEHVALDDHGDLRGVPLIYPSVMVSSEPEIAAVGAYGGLGLQSTAGGVMPAVLGSTLEFAIPRVIGVELHMECYISVGTGAGVAMHVWRSVLSALRVSCGDTQRACFVHSERIKTPWPRQPHSAMLGHLKPVCRTVRRYFLTAKIVSRRQYLSSGPHQRSLAQATRDERRVARVVRCNRPFLEDIVHSSVATSRPIAPRRTSRVHVIGTLSRRSTRSFPSEELAGLLAAVPGGVIVEIYGSAVPSLTPEARTAVASMGAYAGVLSVVFPPIAKASELSPSKVSTFEGARGADDAFLYYSRIGLADWDTAIERRKKPLQPRSTALVRSARGSNLPDVASSIENRHFSELPRVTLDQSITHQLISEAQAGRVLLALPGSAAARTRGPLGGRITVDYDFVVVVFAHGMETDNGFVVPSLPVALSQCSPASILEGYVCSGAPSMSCAPVVTENSVKICAITHGMLASSRLDWTDLIGFSRLYTEWRQFLGQRRQVHTLPLLVSVSAQFVNMVEFAVALSTDFSGEGKPRENEFLDTGMEPCGIGGHTPVQYLCGELQRWRNTCCSAVAEAPGLIVFTTGVMSGMGAGVRVVLTTPLMVFAASFATNCAAWADSPGSTAFCWGFDPIYGKDVFQHVWKNHRTSGSHNLYDIRRRFGGMQRVDPVSGRFWASIMPIKSTPDRPSLCVALNLFDFVLARSLEPPGKPVVGEPDHSEAHRRIYETLHRRLVLHAECREFIPYAITLFFPWSNPVYSIIGPVLESCRSLATVVPAPAAAEAARVLVAKSVFSHLEASANAVAKDLDGGDGSVDQLQDRLFMVAATLVDDVVSRVVRHCKLEEEETDQDGCSDHPLFLCRFHPLVQSVLERKLQLFARLDDACVSRWLTMLHGRGAKGTPSLSAAFLAGHAAVVPFAAPDCVSPVDLLQPFAGIPLEAMGRLRDWTPSTASCTSSRPYWHLPAMVPTLLYPCCRLVDGGERLITAESAQLSAFNTIPLIAAAALSEAVQSHAPSKENSCSEHVIARVYGHLVDFLRSTALPSPILSFQQHHGTISVSGLAAAASLAVFEKPSVFVTASSFGHVCSRESGTLSLALRCLGIAAVVSRAISTPLRNALWEVGVLPLQVIGPSSGCKAAAAQPAGGRPLAAGCGDAGEAAAVASSTVQLLHPIDVSTCGSPRHCDVRTQLKIVLDDQRCRVFDAVIVQPSQRVDPLLRFV